MQRYRKMLVAVDGSESSKNAFCQACSLALHDHSWMGVVTAVPPYQDQFQSLGIREKVVRTLRDEAERVMADIRKAADAIGVFIRPILTEGSPEDVILDISEENHYDLIVLGRRGKSSLEQALVGSVAAKIIARSTRDVLVVPKGAVLGWDSLLVATDGSAVNEAACDKAVALATEYGSSLAFLSVVDVTEEFQAQAPERLDAMVATARKHVEAARRNAAAAGVKAEAYVREGETFRVITSFAKELASDAIIMGNRGRSGVRRLILGSITEKVIGHAPCPVLIVKARGIETEESSIQRRIR